MESLTARQKETLDYIIGFQKEHTFTPTLREIAAHFGVTVGTIQDHNENLKKAGYLMWQHGKPRTFTFPRGA